MADPRLVEFANLLVNYSTRVRPGDRVAVRGFPLTGAAQPLILELVQQILSAGGHPHVLMQPEGAGTLFLQQANDDQLDYVNPWVRMISESFDVDLRISSASNTRANSNLDPARMNRWREANKEVIDTWFRRTGSGALRWVATRFPTPAYAQDAEMSLVEFEDFFYRSCYIDQDDPIESWSSLATTQARAVERLNRARSLHLRGPDIDLQLDIAGRKFIACSGETNMPDGEIFTGPVEESASGWVRFSYPCIYVGVEVEGVELRFEQGRVVEARATKNEQYLQSTLASDAGASYLGELGIGTNTNIQRFSRSMLFDEKMAGTIHLALGGGYPETGSKNHSSIHWDMLVDMRHEAELLADGELIYRNGEFLLD